MLGYTIVLINCPAAGWAFVHQVFPQVPTCFSWPSLLKVSWISSYVFPTFHLLCSVLTVHVHIKFVLHVLSLLLCFSLFNNNNNNNNNIVLFLPFLSIYKIVYLKKVSPRKLRTAVVIEVLNCQRCLLICIQYFVLLTCGLGSLT